MARNRRTISNELKDRYFHIDYLRLHRYGKSNEIWKKNRNMLVKEHEYSDDPSVVSRKGYQSYIQRCLKSILEDMYPDFEKVKPRRVFGYELGEKNDQNKDLLDLRLAEDRIKLLISRYLQTGDNSEAILRYRDAVLTASRVSFKNKEAGLKIVLDDQRSFGYQAVKELKEIREKQDVLLEIADDTDSIMKSMMVQGIARTWKMPVGTRVQRVGRNGPENIFGTIARLENQVSYGSPCFCYEVQWDNMTGQRTVRVNLENLIPVFGDQESVPEVEENSVSPLLDRIIDHANVNFGGRGSQGLDRNVIFNLARGAIVREILSDGDVHTAGIVRQIEATPETLARIDFRNEYVWTDEEGVELDEEVFDDLN